jgi:beta-barrel assembly-enhancing protease
VRHPLFASSLALALAVLAFAQIKEPKPGFNVFNKEQDVQLGREAAAEVEKQYEVVNNAELQRYIDQLGAKLVRSRRASDFPYYFKVVADDSINAFALPGGPMYLNTGLFKAADNEAQLAGVMAHEISHVALRHGTNQASKANLIQLPALLAGSASRGGMLGGLAQLGIGLGANSVLMNFSRSAETQADTNGVLILADAGLNPVEMARFFEKLQAAGGRQGRLAEFFSSHPNPGNRRQNIESLVRQLPRAEFSNGDDAAFRRAQEVVNRLPAPRPRPQPQQQRTR